MARATAPRRSRRAFQTGIALLAAGVLLLAAAAFYYGYGVVASRNLDNIVVQNPDAVELLPQTTPPSGASSQPTAPYQQEVLPQPTLAAPDSGAPEPPRPDPELAQLYPGSLLPARQWADPRGTIALPQPDISGFTPLSSAGQPVINGVLGRADRIVIPQLHIDAPVEELGIADPASSIAYETPKFIVGHIPATPNPGSHGNGWYFGHLESPVEGEGNVFASLPRIANLIRDGEDVHAILRAGNREYLYAVSRVDLLHRDEMKIYGSDDARVTLVTCYPRLRYDHRLLVTAQLIGFKNAQPA